MTVLNSFDDFHEGMIIRRKNDNKEFVIISVEHNGDDNYYSYMEVIELNDIKEFNLDQFYKSSLIKCKCKLIENSTYDLTGIEDDFDIVKENAYKFETMLRITEVKE